MKPTLGGHPRTNSVAESGLGRREFLVFGSSAAAATLAFGPQMFAGVFADARALAIGFVPIEEIDGERGDAFDARLRVASRLRRGDRTFARKGAQVTIAGAAAGDAQRLLSFRPHYRLEDGRDIAVHAWSFTTSTSNASGPSRFVMPLDDQEKALRFSLVARSKQVVDGKPVDNVTNVALSLRHHEGAVKLVRGYYVIVPLFDEAEPRWSSYTLLRDKGNLVMHERYAGETRPVAREHVVLRVDHAA